MENYNTRFRWAFAFQAWLLFFVGQAAAVLTAAAVVNGSYSVVRIISLPVDIAITVAMIVMIRASAAPIERSRVVSRSSIFLIVISVALFYLSAL